MALVATYAKKFKRDDTKNGNVVVHPGTLAFDSSYPSGGEAITGWDTSNILEINIERSGTYDFLYDHVAKKVVAWDTGTSAEVANLTDLSALTAVKFEVVTRL